MLCLLRPQEVFIFACVLFVMYTLPYSSPKKKDECIIPLYITSINTFKLSHCHDFDEEDKKCYCKCLRAALYKLYGISFFYIR